MAMLLQYSSPALCIIIVVTCFCWMFQECKDRKRQFLNELIHDWSKLATFCATNIFLFHMYQLNWVKAGLHSHGNGFYYLFTCHLIDIIN